MIYIAQLLNKVQGLVPRPLGMPTVCESLQGVFFSSITPELFYSVPLILTEQILEFVVQFKDFLFVSALVFEFFAPT